ncbi:MAG TPA: ABC transporter permease [Candidatus Onthocola gallistercoris]|uniref:ABC transporter permease n=1 Tax=Candidatus Onthocola gallistercoris TaxID=2840876 RepID=A0A9D1KVB1_9FIRM|nr:ABC transporter permease [Candidatus Onthocola gallistercoris]
MDMLLSTLEQGLIYGIMALGVYITYKILDFPDLTVDGSFPLGAAVAAVLVTKGVNPYLTLLAAFASGVLAGVCTGLIHVKLKVRDLLSGIIMMTALYTINLKIAGKANLPLFTKETIFDNPFLAGIVPTALTPYVTLIIIVIITLIAKYLLDAYLKTRSGYLLRAVGDNDTLVTCLAKDQGLVKIVGLAISNGLVALGGAVYAHEERFFDISMGTGTMVIGLASVIIGTNLFKNFTIMRATTSVLVGSVIYKACVAIAIACGLDSSSMKLITAVLFLIILVISMDRKRKVKNHA